jgi:hypothetical protein
MTRKVLRTPLQPLRNVLVIVAEWAEVIGNLSSSGELDSEENLEAGWSLRT